MLTGESLTMVVSPGISSEKCWFPVESAEAKAGLTQGEQKLLLVLVSVSIGFE